MAVLLLAVLGSATGWNLTRLLDRRQALLEWTDAHPFLSAALYFAGYTAAMSVALPGAAVLSLLGGFLFGRWLGVGLVLVAATTGASIVFVLARSAMGGPLRRRAGMLPGTLAKNLRANGFEYLLFLRLLPVFPFFLVNLAAALFDVTFRTFLVASVLGMLPATVIYVSLGLELGRVSNPRDLASPSVLLALAALALLAFGPVLYRRWKDGRQPTPEGGG